MLVLTKHADDIKQSNIYFIFLYQSIVTMVYMGDTLPLDADLLSFAVYLSCISGFAPSALIAMYVAIQYFFSTIHAATHCANHRYITDLLLTCGNAVSTGAILKTLIV